MNFVRGTSVKIGLRDRRFSVVLLVCFLMLLSLQGQAREPAKLTLGVSGTWVNTGVVGQSLASDVG